MFISINILFILFLVSFNKWKIVYANVNQASYTLFEKVLNPHYISTFAKGLEKESIDEATIAWMNTVTTYGDTSQQVSELYSDNAVLWGTVSKDLRYTCEDVKNYFEYFANIPGLTVKPGSFKCVVQVFGIRRNIAISSGYYEFLKPDGNGGITSIPARFTFAYKKQKYGNKWEIINHHSSIIPKQPNILQGVFKQVRSKKYNELESYQEHLRKRAYYCNQINQYKNI